MAVWPWQISWGNKANAQLKENVSNVLRHASRHQIDSLGQSIRLLDFFYSHAPPSILISNSPYLQGCLFTEGWQVWWVTRSGVLFPAEHRLTFQTNA